MEHRIPCQIVQDLLPLYVEELTSEFTNTEIKKHIEVCVECKSHYNDMKKTIHNENENNQEDLGKEINYLKKIKRNTNQKVFIGISIALLICITAIAIKLYVIGFPTDSYYITYMDGDEENVNFGGALYDMSYTYKGYRTKMREDGKEEIVIYAALASFWRRDIAFNIDINRKDVKSELYINGNIVKPDGTVITKLANDLYHAKNKYIGDMASNGKIVSILGITNTLGNFKNSLQTSTEPYGWTLEFVQGTSNSVMFDERMKNYACVLIALIDNLGEVDWNYTVETEEAAIERSNNLTEKQCTDYVGVPIKEFSESPEKVQDLLDFLSIRNQ
ncbi:MAG: anti-sigma factor [Herbinix sp.]|jgi:hypothetical protein|nr:anti-sigma factor [Herbinix sp.]